MENNKAVVYYYIKDHLGSVKALVDENGNPVQEYEYGAYGKTKVGRVTDSSPTNFVENRYAYTSREWEEETGDYYYRARYYDPSEGRFLSEDPIGFSGGDWNLYRYITNSPLINRDVFGLRPDDGGDGDFGRAAGHMTAAFLRMLLENTKNSDKFWHCLANCSATQSGKDGELAARLISDLREYSDKLRKDDPDSACEADQNANFHGREYGRQNMNCISSCYNTFSYKRAY